MQRTKKLIGVAEVEIDNLEILGFNHSVLLEVGYEFTPERPAPFCSNHDDPRFSDPGDDAEIEYTSLELVSAYDEDGFDHVEAWRACDVLSNLNAELSIRMDHSKPMMDAIERAVMKDVENQKRNY